MCNRKINVFLKGLWYNFGEKKNKDLMFFREDLVLFSPFIGKVPFC